MVETHVDEVARYGLKIEQLYVNGNRATRARTPDTGWFFVEKADETIHYKGTGRSPEYATQRIQAKPEDMVSLQGLSEEELNEVMAIINGIIPVNISPWQYLTPVIFS